MKEFNNRLVLIISILMLAMGWLSWWVVTQQMKMNIFYGYPVVPVIYYLSGLLLIFVLGKVDKTKSSKLVNVYMLIQIIKMLFFGIVAFVFIKMLGGISKQFIVIYAAYYLVFLIFETYALLGLEKRIKKGLK